MPTRGLRSVVTASLIALAFLVCAFVSRQIGGGETQTMPVWLGSGLVFGAFLVAPRWAWPAVFGGSFVAAFVWGLVDHFLSLGGAFVFAAIEAGAMLVGAWVTTATRRDGEDGLRNLAAFVAGAALAAVLGALLAVELWRWQRPHANLALEWRAWAFSEALGVLLIAPLILAFRGFRVKRSGGMTMTQFLGGAAVFLAFLMAVLIVFSAQEGARFGSIAPTLGYVPVVPLVITGLLWGPRGGALATLAGALLMIQRTAEGGGPFAIVDEFRGESVIEVQAYAATMVLVVLIVQALSEGRRVALEATRAWRLRYERTLDAAGVASVEFDAVSGKAVWGDGASHVLGIGIESVPTAAAWHARIDAAERGLVEAAWHSVARGEQLIAQHEYLLRLSDGRDVRINERLAVVRGPDGMVEQVVGLLRAEEPGLPGLSGEEDAAHG